MFLQRVFRGLLVVVTGSTFKAANVAAATPLLLRKQQQQRKLKQGQLHRGGGTERKRTTKPTGGAGDGGQAPTGRTRKGAEENNTRNARPKGKSEWCPATAAGTREATRGRHGRQQASGASRRRERDPQTASGTHSTDTRHRTSRKRTTRDRTKLPGSDREHHSRGERTTEELIDTTGAADKNLSASGDKTHSSRTTSRHRGAGTGETKSRKLRENRQKHKNQTKVCYQN